MITAKKMSEQRDHSIVYNFMKNREEYSTKPLEISYLNCGAYIACIYYSDWFIGLVEEVCEEEGDVKVRFLHPKTRKLFFLAINRGYSSNRHPV